MENSALDAAKSAATDLQVAVADLHRILNASTQPVKLDSVRPVLARIDEARTRFETAVARTAG